MSWRGVAVVAAFLLLAGWNRAAADCDHTLYPHGCPNTLELPSEITDLPSPLSVPSDQIAPTPAPDLNWKPKSAFEPASAHIHPDHWDAPGFDATTRTFAGPDDIPPNLVSAYGVVAFPRDVTATTRERYLAACRAFVATFVASGVSALPLYKQMITVWPVTSKDVASELNVADLTAHEGKAAPEDPTIRRERKCAAAVDNYSLSAALQALYETGGEAKRSTKVGPFLLAWAPGKAKGVVEAPVLVLDLSSANTEAEFVRYFGKWRNDIQENPQLWSNGWSLEVFEFQLGDFLDSSGATMIAMVHLGQ